MGDFFAIGWVIFVIIVVLIKKLAGEKWEPRIDGPPPNPDRARVESLVLDYWLKQFTTLPETYKAQALNSLSPQEYEGVRSVLVAYSEHQVERRHLTLNALMGIEKVRQWLRTRSLEAHLVLFNALSDDLQLTVLERLNTRVLEFSSLNNL